MSLLLTLAATWVLAACGLPAGPPPTAGGPDPDAPIASEVARALLDAVNAARASERACGARGTFPAVPALRLEARLLTAAQAHADDMHEHGFMSHTGSDGSGPGERIARTGYQAASWGENVAWGYPTVDAVMAGWLGSDGHCANLMHPGFSELGAGESGRYWALVFARAR